MNFTRAVKTQQKQKNWYSTQISTFKVVRSENWMLQFHEKIETRLCNAVIQSFDEENGKEQKTCKLTWTPQLKPLYYLGNLHI